ncbi:MAG: CPBP family glutamic-type intramembrane protease [Candidatus Edwardsbacteria bacterium]|jgi:membrane protease YdiL (CAAX protease family)|nr:CPBP family glutamic-type intramembrane protease [Candidatus Edwardsbacteria bacterium]
MFTVKEVLPLCIISLAVGFAAYVMATAPATIPIHFSDSGQPNGWGSRDGLILVPLLIMAVVYLFATFYPMLPVAHSEQELKQISPYAYVIKTVLLALLLAFQVDIVSHLPTAKSGPAGQFQSLFVIVFILGITTACCLFLFRSVKNRAAASTRAGHRFLIIWVACAVGYLSGIPLIRAMLPEFTAAVRITAPPAIVLIALLPLCLLAMGLAIIIADGYSRSAGMGTPLIDAWVDKSPSWPVLKSFLFLSLVSALAVAVTTIGIDRVFFIPLLPAALSEGSGSTLWQDLITSLYGGIVEEVLLRYLLMSVIVVALRKACRFQATNNTLIWTAILASSFVFGVSHLPITAAIAPLTAPVVLRALLLNGIGGVLFGWLYWKKGLESSIVTHFMANVFGSIILSFS